MYASSLGVLDCAMSFGELNPDDGLQMPKNWPAIYGEDYAKIRHRIARAAWSDQTKAPIALKLAQMVTIGIAKARAVEKQIPITNLNIMAVQMPLPELPRKRLPDVKR
jgi:hypothetical protein